MRFDISRLESFCSSVWRCMPLAFWVAGLMSLILIEAWSWAWVSFALMSFIGWLLHLYQSRPSQSQRLLNNRLERLKRSSYQPRRYRW